MQAEAPAVSEYVPEAQDKHVAELFTPSTELYVPAGHFVHTCEPFVLSREANVPLGHPLEPQYDAIHPEKVFETSEAQITSMTPVGLVTSSGRA